MKKLTLAIAAAGLACAGSLAACHSRTFHSEEAGTKSVPLSSVPRRFVTIEGRVDAPLRLLSLRARVRLLATSGAGSPARGCVGETEQEGEADVIGRGVQADGSVELLARSALEGERTFRVDVPARLGALVDRCRFRLAEGLSMEFEALTERSTRVFFHHTVAAAEVESALSQKRAIVLTLAPTAFDSEQENARGLGTSLAALWNPIAASAQAQGAPLPSEPGLPTAKVGLGVVGNALGLDLRDERVRADQMRTLSSRADTREPTTKAFHPFGACAKGRWIINADTGFSGLFGPGTDVPAIVRFSGAGNNATTKADFGIVHRMSGLAIKLFPSQREDEQVETQQILTFDDAGPMGSGSPWSLFDAPGPENKAFFVNWLYGNSIPARGTVNSFARAVAHPRNAPLSHPAAVGADGRYVSASAYAAPSLVRIQFSGRARSERHTDLRAEIAAYPAGDIAFDVFLYPAGTDPQTLKADAASGGGPKRAGRIVVTTRAVVSEACDTTLHFAHSPQ